MGKSNKQILEDLQKHFLESDPKVVARALANMMLDFHRLGIIEGLPKTERDCLLARITLNERQFMDFVKNGPKERFTVINVPSGDDGN